MCRWVFLAAVAGALACVGGAGASPSLPPLPARWPHTLQLGMADEPGGAATLRKVAPFGFRYQYLAGGVNTGQGWSTWNPNGSFVTRYDEESWAADEIPVFSYYMLLQSSTDPTTNSGDEATTDLEHLRDPQLMLKYWDDVRLMLEVGQRVGAKLRLSELHARLLEQCESAGLGDQDNSAVIRAFDPD